MTVHDDLQAIPHRITQLEKHVALLELAIIDLTKQNAALWHRQTKRHTPDAYTITETAQRLNLTRTQIYELIAAGRLHPVTIGTRARRIPADEIDRLLAQDAERRPI